MSYRREGTKKDHAMFFFTSDWMSDVRVQAMTWEQRGMYHWLLCLAWNEGDIPADETALRRILRLTPRRFAKVWPDIAPCWTRSEDGRLVQARLEQERAIRAELSQKRARAGSKGGANGKQTP